MTLLNYTSTVPGIKSAGEIQAMLARHGATKVSTIYNGLGEKAAPVGIAFVIDTPIGRREFELPANVDGVSAAFTRERVPPRYRNRAQAERTAWRILKDWVEAQLAVIDAGVVDLDEVMLPWMVTGNGRTLAATYRDSPGLQEAIGGLTRRPEIEAS